MNKIIPAMIILFLLFSVSHATTEGSVDYQIDGVAFEGFYISAGPCSKRS